MKFKEFNSKIQAQFKRMCDTGKLFKSSISGNEVWDLYLNSFDPIHNGIFRDANSSEHNCNCCKNFIKRYGNIVAIVDDKIESIFSNIDNVGEYTNSAKQCSKILENSNIQDVFFETYDMLNTGLNYEKTNKNQSTYKLGIGETYFQYTKEYEDSFGHKNSDGTYRVDFNKVYTFNHFELDLPKQFVDFSGKSIESIMANYRDKHSIFRHTMDEIQIQTYTEAIDGINKKYAVNSDKYIPILKSYIEYKNIFDTNNDKNVYCWDVTYSMSDSFARMGNSNLGKSLLYELQTDKELDVVYSEFNKREDPENKFKSEKPSSAAMQLLANKTIEELDLVQQFTSRRHTTLDDVKSNVVSFINKDDNKSKINLFNIDTLDDNNLYNVSQFDTVNEISIDEFTSNIDKYKSVELLLDNTMSFFNMTSCNIPNLKPMFKYGNNYSFTVNGKNAGESQIKTAVKERGGNIDADVAIRLHFPDTTDDYDLYINEPNNNVIYYRNKRHKHTSSGMLDLDAQGTDGYFPPERRVENVTYTDKHKMPIGNYYVYVNNHPDRKLNTTFYLDIEIDGEITQLKLKTLGLCKPLCAVINWDGTKFSLKVNECMEILQSKSISKQIFGLDSLKFHKVTCICPSPDHWNTKIGTLHYLFALKNAHNDSPIPTFHVDNLIPELLPHRKAIQSLMNITAVKSDGEQFAGVCFNSTYNRTIICRVEDNTNKKKVIKVKI